jgi:hypothetical protein
MAWTNALALARDEVEREGVYIHFARIEAQTGQFADAHKRLDAVTNDMYADLKRRVARSLNDKEHPEQATNEPPDAVDLPVAAGKTNGPEGIVVPSPSPRP